MRNLILIILAVITFTASSTAQDSIITKRTIMVIGSDTTGIITITKYDTTTTQIVANDTVVTPFVTNDTIGVSLSPRIDAYVSFSVSNCNYLRTLEQLQNGVPIVNNETEFVELTGTNTKPLMIDGTKTLVLYFKPN